MRLGIADLTSRLGVSELVQRGWTRVFDRREAAAEVVLRFMA